MKLKLKRNILKMKNIIYFICVFLFIIGKNIFAETNPIVSDTLDRILINQVGYQPNASKIALLRVNTNNFQVIESATGKVVFTGKPGRFQYWKFSGDSVSSADFSKITKPGKYRLRINKQIYSCEFTIGSNVYNEVTKASVKALYLNRSATEITKEFGGKWARPAGHPDTVVYIHSSAATEKRPEGTVISSPGGWYDAGDYNKYPVNSSITTYTFLLFCQMYPDYIKTLSLNIPESKNNIPDVMDELLFNLRWMLTMQDPNDDGVYHKLTNKGFDGMIMPDKSVEPRYVVAKSTAASLDFAATMAMAYRVFSKSGNDGLEKLGKTCLEAANKAYSWVKANPVIYFKNPSDIHTGEYPNTKLSDEYFWAATELALSNNNTSLVSTDEMKKQQVIVPSWDTLGMLGVISLSLTDNPNFTKLKADAQKILLGYTNELVQVSEKSPYKVSLDFFKWGSNSDVANMALLKLVAYRISGEKKYIASIQGDLDYILGRNATGYSFVTGFGCKQAMHIHHRPSAADGVQEPYPGFLVGGPNIVTFGDCGNKVFRSKWPAKSYADAECSYSTNEIAINWNAPLFFVLGAMDSMGK
jgi:endoglucanase